MRKGHYWLSCVIFITAAITIAGLNDLRSEHVFLKDGSIVQDAAKSGQSPVATAVDGGKEESLPSSNEIAVTTKILPQEWNGKAVLKQGLSNNDKEADAILEYGPARDTDDVPSQFGKSADPAFYVGRGRPWGEERRLLHNPPEWKSAIWTLSVRSSPVMYVPIGQMDDLYGFGYGFTAGVFVNDLFFNNFIAGIDLGYAYWTSGHWLVEYMHMMSLSAWAGYRFRVTSEISVIPSLKIGAVDMLTRYSGCGESGVDVFETRDKNAVEIMFGGSLEVEYAITRSVSIHAGGEYTCIYETGEMPMFFGVKIGAGFNF